MAALEAGKHVFVEKPLALSLDDADALIERHRGSGLQAVVGFNLRSHRVAGPPASSCAPVRSARSARSRARSTTRASRCRTFPPGACAESTGVER